MKKYTIMIKSHTEVMDLEETTEAKNKEEAMEIFRKRFPDLKEWDDFELLRNIEEEE